MPLVLAFLPAALALGFGTMSGQNGPSRAVLWSICGGGLVCCFTSSFMLIRRKTGWAIAGGILLFMLNAAISFFAGCVALLQGMKF
jgi:hypothetical protein